MDDSGLNAFCDYTDVPVAHAAEGPLAGMTMAVKDLFDVVGYPTGCGQPSWPGRQVPAVATAPAVQSLLDAGARFVGKTQTDEIAYSLNGENAHYGTPVNPNAPGRVPGGSSSGSASATAGGLVDFAIGTDTGGSVRLPASFCGLFGVRPTHGAIPLDGCMALAPSFDVLGWFARDVETLRRVGATLLPAGSGDGLLGRPVIATDAFELLAPDVAEALRPGLVHAVKALGLPRQVAVADGAFDDWMQTFRICQAAEIWEVHGAWVERDNPQFGPGVAERMQMARAITADQRQAAQARREEIRRHLNGLIDEDTVLLMPTAPGIAPLLQTPPEDIDAFRSTALSLLCIAGLAGMPQVTLPLCRMEDCPIGLSLIGAPGQDAMLLAAAVKIMETPAPAV